MEAIGDRMKSNYESRDTHYLTRRTPVIIRLDGKAFHTLTRHCEKPFDWIFASVMNNTTSELCRQIQGCKFAYIQSDEISLLLTDYDRLSTQAWFDYNISKMTSVSAGIASTVFTNDFKHVFAFDGYAVFDSRAFNIPKEEVANYFVWRQLDWTRNSIQMLSQSHFSHKQLHGKNQSDMHEMLFGIGVNWADLKPEWKNGRILQRNECGEWVLTDAPIFTQNRNIIEQWLEPKEE